MNKGVKETFMALGYAIGAGVVVATLVWLLSGCAGSRVLIDYEHHSSAQDFNDSNESNHVGIIFATKLRWQESQCDRYCPEIEVGLHYEPRDEVFGRNPVGTVRIRQPIWVKP